MNITVPSLAVAGVAFLARAALYALRIKPELDRWHMPLVASTVEGDR